MALREDSPTSPLAPDLATSWRGLRRRGWLAQRSREHSDALRAIARLIEIEAGAPVYRAGDPANGVFGPVSGTLAVSINAASSHDFTFHRAEAGFWIGDLALFANQERLVSVHAVSRSVLVHLPQVALAEALSTMPHLYADFYELSYNNVGMLLRIIGNLLQSPSDARVARRLLLQAEQQASSNDWIELSQTQLAGLVGLSGATLQRILRRLDHDGLIELGYGRVRVLDFEKLTEVAGADSQKANIIK